MSTERNDAELLSAHCAGDRDAFEELVRRHRDRLWSVALGTLRHPEDAADAVQDALLSAYRSAGSFRGDAAVSTWLHRIVVNACLDRLRRAKVRPTAALPDEGPGEPADPRDRVAERDIEMAVRDALAQLGADQRAAIVLVDLQGYSVADAAEVLDVPAGTVKSRCARGRLALAGLLAPLRDAEPRNRTGGSRVSPGQATDGTAGEEER